ncbi:MAG: hypothetical protein V3R27_02825 [Pseudomonadales bacterium]
MRRLVYISALLVSVALVHSPATYADEAVTTMANIVIGLKHFPSDADKAALAAIADGDSSDAEKSVASAIANISHKVTDADKATLAAISADDDASAELRKLAMIVGNLNHMPSADAVASLEGLANP